MWLYQVINLSKKKKRKKSEVVQKPYETSMKFFSKNMIHFLN